MKDAYSRVMVAAAAVAVLTVGLSVACQLAGVEPWRGGVGIGLLCIVVFLVTPIIRENRKPGRKRRRPSLRESFSRTNCDVCGAPTIKDQGTCSDECADTAERMAAW